MPLLNMDWLVTWVVIAPMSTSLYWPSTRSQSAAAVGKSVPFSAGCAASNFGRATARPAASATHRPCHTGAGGGVPRSRFGHAHYSTLDRGCQAGPSSFNCPLHCCLSPRLQSTSIFSIGENIGGATVFFCNIKELRPLHFPLTPLSVAALWPPFSTSQHVIC